MAKRKTKQKVPEFAERGAVITAHRGAKGLTRKQMEELTGLSYRTYSNAENGYAVSDETLLAICRVLKLDFQLLKYDPLKHPAPGNATHGIASVKFTYPPYEQLTQDEVFTRIISLLREFAEATDHWLHLRTERGSTIITFRMTYGDIYRLYAAFARGDLRLLGVAAVTLDPSQQEPTPASSPTAEESGAGRHHFATTARLLGRIGTPHTLASLAETLQLVRTTNIEPDDAYAQRVKKVIAELSDLAGVDIRTVTELLKKGIESVSPDPMTAKMMESLRGTAQRMMSKSIEKSIEPSVKPETPATKKTTE